ncbi:uncharacterized protein N7484_009340 [Penicillium longicatenatum]|uniref:uncharacterized protein n=1 Tax=Penicillium longicatenatum TaxID=1561947 RepID=UPI0025484016|nr:uncharacterized protein N7484_009340 [Penicillium longicatenatum]KAJ5636027.1 hypothetical protein N7484_009340 [Penicillium longicatenatum]
MPDIIDLISSDPPIADNPPPQYVPQSTQPIPQRPSRLGLISSDPVSAPLFTHDGCDIPPKKRRVSREDQSPLRHTTLAFPSSLPSIQFSDDDFGLPPSRPMAPKTRPGPNVDNSDPIVFTSPEPERRTQAVPSGSLDRPYAPPPPTSLNKTHDPSDIITIDDDDANPPMATGGNRSYRCTQDSIEEFSDPFSIPGFADIIGTSTVSKPKFSSKTAELLASLSANDKPTDGENVSKKGNRKYKIAGIGTRGSNLSDDDINEPASPRRPAKKSGKMTTEEKEARAKARAEAKAQKELERELEKARKLKLKEEKAKQKQVAADISEVNKLKVDKKDSTPEMIIHVESSLEDMSVGTQTVEFMKRLGVEYKFFDSPIPNLIKWSRKVKAIYNETAGHWEPCALHIEAEKHVLCLVPAQDFVDMVIPSPDEERETLELHVLKIRSAYPNHKIIYLIEGLTAWMRKNQNARNRAYQAEVLRQYEQPAPEPATARRRGRKQTNKPETTPPVDDDTIEDALLTLQVTHACLIHHTGAPAESAEWIKNFTEHISTIPYRREMMEGNDAAFCMDAGQVKTGEDNLDTFVKMLQEINRVTASMSYGIAAKYPCVTDLVRGMRMHGPTMLEDVRKSANKNGALTDSRVGPAASKRLYKVFTGLDPTSTDV